MSESSAESTHNSSNDAVIPEIPIEIVSDEEMAFIDAALAAASRCSLSSSTASAICSWSRSPLLSSQIQITAVSVKSISALSKRGSSGLSSDHEIEDLGMTQKRKKVAESFLDRFRKKRGLSVTDITGTEWCERQMEFILLFGKRKVSKAMEVGRARHEKLEEEVSKKVKVSVQSFEDVWAIKLINFLSGTNQLIFEGLTRELPLFAFVEGVWMVGIIDEIQMPSKETSGNPKLVDTKTRVKDTLPAESQRRNGRLQLMCYKYMWDLLVAGKFPEREFFDFFSLDRDCILSEEIRENTANAGFPAKTLNDIVKFYRNTCKMLPPADNQLLLRYELQRDQSLPGEVEFEYDDEWVKSQIRSYLEFWKGKREAADLPVEERWKCQYCQYLSVCPANSQQEKIPSPSKTKSNNSTPS